MMTSSFTDAFTKGFLIGFKHGADAMELETKRRLATARMHTAAEYGQAYKALHEEVDRRERGRDA